MGSGVDASGSSGTVAGAQALEHRSAPRVAQVSGRALAVSRATSGSGGPAGPGRGATTLGTGSRLDGLSHAPRVRALARPAPPRWLPARTRGLAGAAARGWRTLSVPAGRLAARPATVEPTAAALSGSGLIRSDLGAFGLSDADDSQLYSDCTPFSLCEEPPDPSIAASTSHVVEAVNELMLVLDRSTGDGQVIDLFDFFALDSNQVTQTGVRILHDNTRARWLATEVSSDCGHGYLHVAVSATDDPLGSWNVYRLVYPGRVVDFPGVGTAGNTVVVGLNEFGPDPESPDCLATGPFVGASLTVIDWADLLGGVPSLAVTTTPADPKLFDWRPAVSAGGDLAERMVVAIDTGADSTSNVGYATLTGTNADRNVVLGPVVDLTQTLGLAPFATPPPPRQPGDPATIVNAVDGQPTDAIATVGRLWFITTAPCRPAGDDADRDCVRLVQLATGAAGALAVASDTVIGEKGKDLFMGGVGRALDGTLSVVYSRSSTTDEISTWATSQPPGSAGFGTPVLLVPGAGEYSGRRWGDWVILAADPASPGAIWQASEVPSTDGSWFTWISRLTPAQPGPLDGSFRINGNDAFAGDAFVALQLDGPPAVALTVVRVANDPTLDGGVLAGGLTLPVADELPWSLDVDAPGPSVPDGPHTVYVQWGDGAGNWSHVASDSITLDTHPPVALPPGPPAVRLGTVSTGGRIPVEVTWPAAKDALSGVEGYAVEVSRDGADFEEFAPSGPSTHADGFVQAGHRYRWRIRAFDQLGNESADLAGPTVRVELVSDGAAAIRYAGAWSRTSSASALGGAVHSTSSAGASATVTFAGRGIAIVAPVGPGRGAVDVVIDGRAAGRVDLGSSAGASRRVVFFRTLAAGNAYGPSRRGLLGSRSTRGHRRAGGPALTAPRD